MFAPTAPQPPHSALENAGVAIKSWFQNFGLALGNCVAGKPKERIRYADLGNGSVDTMDHSPEEYPEFREEKHRKYFGHVYFQSVKSDEADSDSGPLEPMKDPKRSKKAQQAYDDYLHGLEMINQQEYLKQELCGQGFSERAIQASSDKVLVKEVDKDDQKGRIYNAETLWEKAKWERLMVLRRHATSARSFYEQLKDRAEAPQTDRPEQWLNYQPAVDGKGPLRRPPIRWKTFEILTRPLEHDWNFGLFLSWAFAIFTYVFTLYTQIRAIADMCSGGYLCPVRDVQIPLIAPPLAFRQAQTNAVFYKSRFGDSWDPQVRETCLVGGQGCEDPGYKIQWPFLQLTAGVQNASIPPGLLDRCTLREGDLDYWMWDPFLLNLTNTYIDCSAGDSPVSFAVDDIAFHFEHAWYDQAKDTTVACMQDLAPRYEIANLARWREGETATEFMEAVELCVGSDGGLQGMADHCMCSTSRPAHPIAHFFATEPVKTCVGGAFDGNLCDTDDNCGTAEAGSCALRFEEDHNPLSASPLYGCFFEEPWAERKEQVRYHICGWTLESKTDAAGNVKSKLQRAVTPSIISKKAGLMITFVIKEASYFTGIFVLMAAFAALTVVALPFLIVFSCFHSRWGDSFPVADAHLLQFGNAVPHADDEVRPGQIKDVVGSVLWMQVLTLWSTCVNFSTAYRMIKFAISLATGHVNVSVHDLDKKLTGVANLMFNLVLLVFQDDIDASIYISLALSLALLLYQMNAEKEGLKAVADVLKDINEMRLSKFETALGLTKVMEDMLEYDIEYNWVAHFYNDEKLYPLEADPDFKPEEHFHHATTHAADEKITLRFMPSMSREVAAAWGHDGKGEFREEFHELTDAELQQYKAHCLSEAKQRKLFDGRPFEAPVQYARRRSVVSAVVKSPRAAAPPAPHARSQPAVPRSSNGGAGSVNGAAMSVNGSHSLAGSAFLQFQLPGPPMGSIPQMMHPPPYNAYSGFGGSAPMF